MYVLRYTSYARGCGTGYRASGPTFRARATESGRATVTIACCSYPISSWTGMTSESEIAPVVIHGSQSQKIGTWSFETYDLLETWTSCGKMGTFLASSCLMTCWSLCYC